jgi:hypothetical protein
MDRVKIIGLWKIIFHSAFRFVRHWFEQKVFFWYKLYYPIVFIYFIISFIDYILVELPLRLYI